MAALRTVAAVLAIATAQLTAASQAARVSPRAHRQMLPAHSASPRSQPLRVSAVSRITTNDNRRPAGRLERGVYTLRLEVREGMLFPEEANGPGVPALAFAEVGAALQVPGPLVRVPQGTEVRVSIHNPLPDSSITVHGLGTQSRADDSGLRIPAGATRQVTFKAETPGTFFYWGTTGNRDLNDREWHESQLSGALVIDAPGAPVEDRVFVIGHWFRPGDSTLAVPRPDQELMVINGRSWPHTERLTFTQGDSVRWRWINASAVSHPMHLHGFYFYVESRGDARTERTYSGDARPFLVTQLMLSGETMRVSWVPERSGNWLFHCHFAFHVSHHLVLKRDVVARGAVADSTTAGGATHASHAAQSPRGSVAAAVVPHQMAGLVLGIHVRPAAGVPVGASTSSARPRARAIRLLAQAAPNRFGRLAGFGYVVQDGPAPPARDSISIPGPLLVLRRGEPVRITVVNHLAEATAVHWHGIELESFPDGVPGWSGAPGRIMPPIAPRDSFVAEFVPPRAGTFIYHTHANEQLQLGSGLYGALLVVDPERPFDSAIDKVILVGGAGAADSLPQFGLESPGLVNGSSAPPPMDLRAGTTYRLRFININPDFRVFFSLMSDSALAVWRPVAKDGADLPALQRAERAAVLLTGPGETADFEFTPATPGEWRLEVKTQISGNGVPGWIIPIRVRVR
ncbi:multicopper oxidase domain-containing protein [Gemmatimonas sp.]|uniref:multicopper oxidase domain-containing protein n=1 Tax=Gemmatimonas sp. TaxID=1962908 RepID=UPI00286B7D76|nr:multicopper oxidase domain-containing protein [Gemmatimonas sp.]